MKKKILGTLCAVIVLITLTGCENNILKTSKFNCTAVECIKKINPENTVEEINDIIGTEGKLIDEKYNSYYWELSEDSGVKMTYYSSDKGTVSIDYDRDSLANNKVDFSRYSELKPRINSGISYNDFISYIGGVDGIIIEKSSFSTKYIWVASNGSYLTGSFSNSSGKCTIASGMIK